MDTILIGIASYRDEELPKTIASLLTRATYPERLRFAIMHQYGPETEGILSRYHSDDRFRIRECSWRESRGVGVARAACDNLYVGEDFYLQIDSHMRCAPRWDERLVAQWQACHDERAIISSYPPAFRYDKDGSEVFVASEPNRLIVHDFFMGDIPTFFGKALSGSPSAPVRSAFAAGGLQFGPGRRCKEVPYEPAICFIGEEVVQSLRLFAANYTIYSPIDQPLYHLYMRTEHQQNAQYFWQNFLGDPVLAPVYHAMNKRSYARVSDYLEGNSHIPPEKVREFENFCGVDFTTKKVHPNHAIAPVAPVAQNDWWRKVAIKPTNYSKIPSV